MSSRKERMYERIELHGRMLIDTLNLEEGDPVKFCKKLRMLKNKIYNEKRIYTYFASAYRKDAPEIAIKKTEYHHEKIMRISERMVRHINVEMKDLIFDFDEDFILGYIKFGKRLTDKMPSGFPTDYDGNGLLCPDLYLDPDNEIEMFTRKE